VTALPPPETPNHLRVHDWTGSGAALFLGCGLLLAVVSPPFVGEHARQFIMAVFSTVCHQLPDRSPAIDGVQLAVCHRCLGVYAAIAAAPFAFLLLRRWDAFIQRNARWFILAGVVIPGIDWLGGVVGMWTNTAASRVATGAAFGLTAGYFLCRALTELFRGRSLRSKVLESL